MKITFSKKEKIFLSIFIAAYIVVAILNIQQLKKTPMEEIFGGLGKRWIVDINGFRFNPMTIMVGAGIAVLLILIAYRLRRFELVPNRKQALIESILETFYEIVDESIPDKRFVKPTFVIATTLFLFIAFSNVIGGAVPGINVVAAEDGSIQKITLFSDIWPAPTGDLNTNLTYAVLVLIISHVFAIRSKGFKEWLKTWFYPNPVMFPINLIGELAKPISHSLRLFGNIGGGAILVYILSYMTKYFFAPIVFWGFFGIFVGLVQAFVFSMLAVAYISSQLS
ncbi:MULTISPECIES: F0F1 ATP synthase subunit A [Thermotoga]|uniref:ATP synthase subunit a n=1 Tax=Thermotoga neapolitana TaxID=2337 RepID=Q8GB07_THENE|nr:MULTISPECIES: F0F1 ATP synthase subunit A [Thermotoga]AJG40935.1 ATP synthase F0F1 subunit A [Thermotoga sp. RQ7]KFZ21837.1 F0F1 ATP synthase subunit A [Thermotoga neapolitana LA10]MDK2949861.1 F-type H+-transporting ATPase subunit a [Thermotoga sp.]BAC22099.1 F-ATPase a-subunit [Thermotoga neapolitana DSM 4359]